MKKILEITGGDSSHWVGDGFPVRSLFSYANHEKTLSPFLLLDFAGPARFEPAKTNRGVGEHPHRGIETVTFVYRGEVSHRDNAGHGGTIGPGDVQWMTAGRGILHEEYHSDDFTREGGTLHMLQLWVNLPARSKMTDPGYQAIVNTDIPVVPLPDNAGQVRVIAGEFEGKAGPARVHSPMHVWDVQLDAGKQATLSLPEGWTAGLVVVEGTVQVNGEAVARQAQAVVLDRSGEEVLIEANNEARLLLLSGEPIDEPVVGYGPFVMNSEAEIAQAFRDFQTGRFGRIAS
jgi:quercetin 2,3-dioxygenase